MRRLPTKGPNSPYSPGIRPLLARTCPQCGELADGDSFPLINQGKGGRRKTCHNCTNANKKRDREQRGIGVPPPRPAERLQTSKYQRWSEGEDRLLRDGIEAGMTYMEIATALGRSLNSIYTRRGILGLAKVRKSHRVAKPWKIQA